DFSELRRTTSLPFSNQPRQVIGISGEFTQSGVRRPTSSHAVHRSTEQLASRGIASDATIRRQRDREGLLVTSRFQNPFSREGRITYAPARRRGVQRDRMDLQDVAVTSIEEPFKCVR